MKKRLVVLLVLMMFSAAAGAATLPLKFGVKAGVAMANVSGDAVEDLLGESPDMRMGLAAGMFVGIPLGGITLQPELLYVQKGATMEESALGYTAKGTMAVDYIEIPVLLKAGFGTGPAKPCIFVGPVLSILMSAKAKAEFSGPGLSESEEEDIKDYVKSTDIGLAFGAGVDIGKLTIDARYVLGLASVADPGDLPAGVETPEAKNAVIMVMLGYSFL